MSTDIFGVRVLGVDRERREVRLRVFVVYYETTARHYLSPPERDPGFFLGLLRSPRRDNAIRQVVSVDQLLDRQWVVEHARFFVEHVERTAVRNDPPTEEDWAELKDFYYERLGHWADEDLLVQADYVVRVTDATWIEHLDPGDGWGDAWYPVDADNPRAEDLPHLPNVHAPAVLRPFGSGAPDKMAFSDDGRFLAVTGYGDDIVVYDCVDWSEHDRFTLGRTYTWFLKWLPGRHVVVLTDLYAREVRQEAYDVDARTAVEVPVEQGFARSRTGRLRVEVSLFPGAEIRVEGGEPVEVPLPDELTAARATFTEDESLVFVTAESPDVYVIDPRAGTIVDTIPNVATVVGRLDLSPDGAYLATSGSFEQGPWEDTGDELCVRRLADGEVVLRHRPNTYITDVLWSPDGRWFVYGSEGERSDGEVRVLPVGLPAEPPAHLRPPAVGVGPA
ncbi:WD40 repeat domain-containing protein [Saccharothrix deserti]|uniref:WD40 repeat domain-containing protein n=1 Tax=Saccharothrix deserti TaxID=2593674 RepID=UPI00131C40AC|nr:hypothetical protein [Saccharothrix deserti]